MPNEFLFRQRIESAAPANGISVSTTWWVWFWADEGSTYRMRVVPSKDVQSSFAPEVDGNMEDKQIGGERTLCNQLSMLIAQC